MLYNAGAFDAGCIVSVGRRVQRTKDREGSKDKGQGGLKDKGQGSKDNGLGG